MSENATNGLDVVEKRLFLTVVQHIGMADVLCGFFGLQFRKDHIVFDLGMCLKPNLLTLSHSKHKGDLIESPDKGKTSREMLKIG